MGHFADKNTNKVMQYLTDSWLGQLEHNNRSPIIRIISYYILHNVINPRAMQLCKAMSNERLNLFKFNAKDSHQLIVIEISRMHGY